MNQSLQMIWQYTLQQEIREWQGMTNKLDAWASERGLTFFPNKTASIIFRKRRKRNEEPLEIVLKN